MIKVPISPSNLKMFRSCPRLYQARYLTKEVEPKTSAAMTRGTKLHELMEQAVLHGWDSINWPEEKNKEYAKGFVATVHKLRDAGWSYQTELGVATDGLGGETGWSDPAPDNFLRSRIDLYATHPDKDYAIIIDWKSGKPWDDALQLHINAFCLQPRLQINKYYVIFAYIDLGLTRDYWVNLDTDKPATVKPEQTSLRETIQVIRDLQAAYEKDKWPPRSGTECKWCQLESCIYKQYA